MNANELTEQFEKHWSNYDSATSAYMLSAAAMLRQQQEQIEELTEKYNHLKQWERRYLDVIESLTKDQRDALNEELRTYDGKQP
jgi:hypothetical protein